MADGAMPALRQLLQAWGTVQRVRGGLYHGGCEGTMTIINAFVGACGGDKWFAAAVFVVVVLCLVMIGVLVACDIEYRRHNK